MEESLTKPLLPKAPPLRDDCFALPAGVDWMPVDQALARLERAIEPVVSIETLPHGQAAGRIVANSPCALRANPPAANSAVDGYGFAHHTLTHVGAQSEGCGGADEYILPLVQGAAAAGSPFDDAVPEGWAIRILTGALLPQGVDTVILSEDCTATATHVAFQSGIKPRANTREAGEDMQSGAAVFPSRHLLRPQDTALLAALGVDRLDVFSKLRVGVLSTGSELVDPATPAQAHQTYDANRPMLLQMVQKWGYLPIDLGHLPDHRDLLRQRLDDAAGQCDVILTSGGASSGDEDYISALLREEALLHAWRIALKPGRPLVLGQWRNVPVFGLPGNPVAAFVCALIFARPACRKLAGGGWHGVQGFTMRAAFAKKKKPGRREYLRARMGCDGVEIFSSEGSGRISGLSWSDGLVELPDAAAHIKPGDPVHYIPYSSFGL